MVHISSREAFLRELEAIRCGGTVDSEPINSAVETKDCLLSILYLVGEIQTTDLATMIQAWSGHVQEIKFCEFTLAGDISLVASALSTCKHVTVFDWRCNIPRDSLAVLGESLARLPLLEKFDFYLPNEISEGPSLYTLATFLVARPNILRNISITDKSMVPDPEVNQFLQACQASSTLEKISFQEFGGSPDFQAKHVSSAAELLGKTQSLEKLCLCIADNVNVVQVAKSLKANRSLVQLESCSDCNAVQEWHCSEASAFHGLLRDSNYTLKYLYVRPWLSSRERTDYVPSWKRVEQCQTGAWKLSDEFKRDLASVSFLLGLNQAGRAELVGAHHSKLIDALAGDTVKLYNTKNITTEDEVSAIYYYLRRNPSLIVPNISSDCGPCKRPAATTKEDTADSDDAAKGDCTIKRPRKANQDMSVSSTQPEFGHPDSSAQSVI